MIHLYVQQRTTLNIASVQAQCPAICTFIVQKAGQKDFFLLSLAAVKTALPTKFSQAKKNQQISL